MNWPIDNSVATINEELAPSIANPDRNTCGVRALIILKLRRC
jgi:hypothetical protein